MSNGENFLYAQIKEMEKYQFAGSAELHILEFEMPSFSNKIHKNRDFLFLM